MAFKKAIASIAAGLAMNVVGTAATADQFMTPTTGEKHDCASAVINGVAGAGSELKSTVFSSDSFVVRSGETPVNAGDKPIVQIQQNSAEPNNFLANHITANQAITATYDNRGRLYVSVTNFDGSSPTAEEMDQADFANRVQMAVRTAAYFQRACSDITVSPGGRRTSKDWHQTLNGLMEEANNVKTVTATTSTMEESDNTNTYWTSEQWSKQSDHSGCGGGHKDSVPQSKAASDRKDPMAQLTTDVNQYTGELLLGAVDAGKNVAVDGINLVARFMNAGADVVKNTMNVASYMMNSGTFAQDTINYGLTRSMYAGQYGMEVMASEVSPIRLVSQYVKDALVHQMNTNPAPFPYKGLNPEVR